MSHPGFSVDVEVFYKVHIQLHTETLHMYVRLVMHEYRHSRSHAASLLPCVSSCGPTHYLCEEGPNFSLISFIKRCGEEWRKRRGGGDRRKKRLGGGQTSE